MPGAVHQVHAFVVPAATSSEEISTIFLEFGLLILGLGIIARLARRWEISAVPFYLLAGLLFGEGGLSVVDSSDALVPTLAELGVILLLLLLGLEYSGDELVQTAQRQSRSGVIDLIANSVPGALVGFAFGWGVPGALALAGVTYISSSGIVAQVKWGTVGILGADRMIEILDEMKVKLEERQLTPAIEKGLENKLATRS